MLASFLPAQAPGESFRCPNMSPDHHGQFLPASYGRCVCLHGAVPVDRPLREAIEHLVDGHPPFEPRQCGAEAEVDAVAEAEVLCGITVDIEAIAVGELSLVAIGRAVEEHHHVPLMHDPSVVLDVAVHRPSLYRRWCLVAEYLFDRLGHQ